MLRVDRHAREAHPGAVLARFAQLVGPGGHRELDLLDGAAVGGRPELASNLGDGAGKIDGLYNSTKD